MRTGRFIPFLSLIGAVLAFVGLRYRTVWRYPNDFLFDNKGDAIKNYFTYTAQSASDSWIQSPVLNYPFGENFLYLDCIPLLTWVLKILSLPFPGILNYSVGILHILMLLALILSAIFLYLILRELKVRSWWAAIGAFGIMMMSPQVFRMTGHLALSFTVFIPMTWYLTIRFFKSKRPYRQAIILGLNILIWFFVHAYLGMIAAVFCGLQMVAAFILYEKSRWSSRVKCGCLILSVILPMIIFWTFISITDHHIGRTTNPWGFFSNNANPLTIFLPHHGIIRGWLGQFFALENQNWAGWAYIGLTSNLLLGVLITGWYQKRKHRNTAANRLWTDVSEHTILRRSLWAGVVVLLFSMALPFSLGLQFLLDWFPIIKKFRACGRFAWVFYYVITVVSVYGLHYLYERYRLRHQGWAQVVVSLLLLIYIVEGWSYHKDLAGQYGQYANVFSPYVAGPFEDAFAEIDSSEYQAILPLPFYHKGSENFSAEPTDKIALYSMALAYRTKLPLWAGFATHSSIPEARMSMQTFAPGFYPKSIEGEISSGKDILLIYSREELNRYESAVLEKSRQIFSSDKFELYVISVEELFRNTARDEIQSFVRKRDDGWLYPKGNYYLSDSSAQVWQEGFDEWPAEIRKDGNGAYQGRLNDRKPLWTLSEGSLQSGKTYVLSLWFSSFGPHFGQDLVNVYVQINEILDNGERHRLAEVRPAWSMAIDGDWSLVEMEFTPRDAHHAIEVFLRGPWRGRGSYYVDDLLLRAKDVEVYRVLATDQDRITGLMKNNHRIFAVE